MASSYCSNKPNTGSSISDPTKLPSCRLMTRWRKRPLLQLQTVKNAIIFIGSRTVLIKSLAAHYYTLKRKTLFLQTIGLLSKTTILK